MNGISNTNIKLDRQERESVLRELFPDRILEDYRLLGSIHPDLLKIAPRISKSQKIRKSVLKLVSPLLKIKGV